MARRVCIYFLPDAPPTPQHAREMLGDYGLFDRFDMTPDVKQEVVDARIATRHVKAGPSGGPGMLMARNPQSGVVYDAHSQVWHGPFVLANNCKPVWFGWFTESPPGPPQFERAHTMPGVALVLGDGRRWVVPVARLQPKRRDVDADGKWCLVNSAAAEMLFERADRLRQQYWEPIEAARAKLDKLNDEAETTDEATATESYTEGFKARVAVASEDVNQALAALDPDVTVEILATNYCVGRPEVAKLGLLEASSHTDSGVLGTHDYSVLYAAVDAAVLNTLVDGEEVHAARAATPDEAKKD